jgi:hypothetical protein
MGMKHASVPFNDVLFGFSNHYKFQVRFQVLMEASMKMTVLWDVAHCCLKEVH